MSAVSATVTEEEHAPRTLPELLAHAAGRGLGGWYFHSGRDVLHLPVTELHSRAVRLSAALSEAGIGTGSRVGIVGRNCPEWASWAWATWLSGAALVPLPAPILVGDSFAAQVASLVGATGCSLVVVEKRYLNLLGGDQVPAWDWSDPTVSLPSPSRAFPSPTTSSLPSDLAIVMCTSGSTASPKAARMSHARAIEWATHNALRSDGGDVPSKVTWFPFFHIAGLGTLFELLTPVEQHILSMRGFLADPSAWLRLVSEHRAAYAVSPSSVWSQVVAGVARDPDGVDLSYLRRVAFNAEMVDPDVLDRLGEAGRRYGLRPGAIAVHYASSEAGMISQTPPGTHPLVDVVDLAELAGSGRAIPARPDRAHKRVVSCGQPYTGAEICVGSPGSPLPERQVGEVWVRGPGVTEGYLAGGEGLLRDGWLRVGDLAYRAEGELFVTGRADEVVTFHGEKYHPEDIEWAVAQVTGLGPRACAAFSRKDGRPGEFVVVVETDDPSSDLVDRVGAAVVDAIGIAPSEVLVVARGTIPTTPNGKLQRSKLRERHARGGLAGRRT